MTNLTDMLSKFVNSNTASTLGSGTLPSNTITNPKVDLKGITTRSGVAYQGPTIPTTSSSPPKVVERETEVTKDTVPPTNNESTKDVQPPVVQVQPQVPNSEPLLLAIVFDANLKPSILYPSRRNDERRCEKANDQIEKFYKIFKDLSFEISLTDALILMPKFASTLKLKSKQRKININLMPLSVWKKLSLPELTPTCITLELADHSITQPIDRTPCINVYEGELTLRVGKEAVTFNLDQTSRYSSIYDDNSVNRIDVIEMACEEYSQEGQILQGEGSTIPVESNHTPINAPSTSQPPTSPPSMQTTHVAEEAATMPHANNPHFYKIGAEANLGYYFMDTTIIFIENDPKETFI
ncbi:hypothetical protein Tco_0379073 [Tanacetum coccineum]